MPRIEHTTCAGRLARVLALARESVECSHAPSAGPLRGPAVRARRHVRRCRESRRHPQCKPWKVQYWGASVALATHPQPVFFCEAKTRCRQVVFAAASIPDSTAFSSNPDDLAIGRSSECEVFDRPAQESRNERGGACDRGRVGSKRPRTVNHYEY